LTGGGQPADRKENVDFLKTSDACWRLISATLAGVRPAVAVPKAPSHFAFSSAVPMPTTRKPEVENVAAAAFAAETRQTRRELPPVVVAPLAW
jgi:hypothetical protein